MLRTGTAKASELGGLFRSMPFTTVFCLIGAGSIAAFPLLSAFVTKAMIMTAALYEHEYIVLGMLLFASAGATIGSGAPTDYVSKEDTISDSSRATPHTTYGATKACCELLLTDYARRGFVDGRGVRLPTIIVRAGAPNAATTSPRRDWTCCPIPRTASPAPKKSKIKPSTLREKTC